MLKKLENLYNVYSDWHISNAHQSCVFHLPSHYCVSTYCSLCSVVVLRGQRADPLDLSIDFNKIPHRKKGSMYALLVYIIPVVTSSSVLNSNQAYRAIINLTGINLGFLRTDWAFAKALNYTYLFSV